jgi:hypothetical protein
MSGFLMRRYDPARFGRVGVAGVRRAGWFNEQDVRFLFGHGAMFDVPGHYEHLAGAQGDAAVPHLNGQAALEYEEEVVGVVVLVPDKLAFDLDDHEVMPVELTDGSRLPVLRERRKFFRQVDGFHDGRSPRSQ